MIINVNQGGKVILAAGAMSSPRILFRSGIGPSEQINIVKSGTTQITLPDESAWIESPVGFVKDHTNLPLTFNATNGMKIMSQSDYTSPSELNIDLWNKASGPLTESSIMRLNTWRAVTTSDNTTIMVQTHNYATKNDTINVLFVLTHGTTSTGTLGITADGNTEWTTSPYLTTDTDKEAMAMAIDEWLEMSRLPNSTIKYTGSANDTGADIVAKVATSAGTHMIGTTIMGPDDGNSVVDTNCKVYGTDNLFVIDAGMHADLPTGNTQAIVGVVAEHAVQKIIALGTGNSSGNGTYTPPSSTQGSALDESSGTPFTSTILPSGTGAAQPTGTTTSCSSSAADAASTPIVSGAASTLSTATSSGRVPVGPSASPSTPGGGNPYWHHGGNSYWNGQWGPDP